MAWLTKAAFRGQTSSFATYSTDETHRYSLLRFWDHARSRRIAFIGLNPSTATEEKNDPTVARCQRFAKDWDFSAFTMLNLFAFRATDPQDMKNATDPVGEHNDFFIAETCEASEIIVCCWGTHGTFTNRHRQVLFLLKPFQEKLRCLGTTKHGHPKHPLYLASNTPLQPFGNPRGL